MIRRPLALLVILLLVSSLPAQQRGRRNQATQLQIRLLLENEHPVDMQLKVQLLSPSGVPQAEVFSRNMGVAEFSVFAGTYRVKASGTEMEDSTSDAFYINENEGSHFEVVRVRLRPANGAGAGNPGQPVSAGELNVPDKARKELEKGNEAMQRERLDEAQQRFKKAITLYPQYASAYNNLGVLYMKAGDQKAGREAFEKAVSLNQQYPRAYINLARLFIAENNFREAENLLKKSLALEPTNPESLTLLARAQLTLGKLEEALQNARKVHSVPHPQEAVAHIIAARVLQSRHQQDEALAEYEQYLKESPDGPTSAKVRETLLQMKKTVR